MSSFFYSGKISSSKSLMNRGLICSSFTDDFKLVGTSSCDDVKQMQNAIYNISDKTEFDCGAAGTVLRFLALRLSRIPGQYKLFGTERLLNRPQNELLRIFDQLGVKAEIGKKNLQINSKGWIIDKDSLEIDRSKSSQFITGVLLSAWDLDFDLNITWTGEVVSDSYFLMTVKMLKQLGMKINESYNSLIIPKGQFIRRKHYNVEIDLSSAFAIAAAGAVAGIVTLYDFPTSSIQPDGVFVEILKKMGAVVDLNDNILKVKKSKTLVGIDWDLKNCPDLFPVLGILCGLAKGKSHLYGAPHLAYKESNRISKTAELLKIIGAKYEIKDDGMIIEGTTLVSENRAHCFETDEDHRLAFAAEIVRKAGWNIEILGKDVVNKSFPDFWDIMKD